MISPRLYRKTYRKREICKRINTFLHYMLVIYSGAHIIMSRFCDMFEDVEKRVDTNL